MKKENKKPKKKNEAKKDLCPFGSGSCDPRILVVLAVIATFLLMNSVHMAASIFASYEIVPPAATPAAACPTSDTLRGDSSYETAPAKSSVAAISAANNLLQSRADTQAGLARNDYSCPNPACQNKRLGSVTATPDAGYPTATWFTLFALAATLFNTDDILYWSGEMEYSWTATVTCN